MAGELADIAEFVFHEEQVGEIALAAACLVLEFLHDALEGHLGGGHSTSLMALLSRLKVASSCSLRHRIRPSVFIDSSVALSFESTSSAHTASALLRFTPFSSEPFTYGFSLPPGVRSSLDKANFSEFIDNNFTRELLKYHMPTCEQQSRKDTLTLIFMELSIVFISRL
jgi:hypothetical protein